MTALFHYIENFILRNGFNAFIFNWLYNYYTIDHELVPFFLASIGGQNIIWIFSNLRVSTF